MNERFIADRITQLRIAKDKSETEMSFDLDRSSSYINMIARYENLPSMSVFLAICEYFEITPAEFFMPELDEDAQKLLLSYTVLSEEEKRTIRMVVDGIIAQRRLAELQSGYKPKSEREKGS